MHPESQDCDLSAYTPAYRLLEEARKTWEHIVCDKIVYSVKSIDVALDFPPGIAKDYLKFRHSWIESHFIFHRERDFHYICIIESRVKKGWRNRVPVDHSADTVNGNSDVFVDVAQFMKSPQIVAANRIWIRSIVRLKRFDDFCCLCRYSSRESAKSTTVGLVENGELSFGGILTGNDRELPDQVVKRSTEIRDRVPSNKRNRVRDIGNLHPDEMHLIFNVILTDKSAGFRIIENSELTPQIFKMFFRPTCLEIGTDQQTHDSQGYQGSSG